MKESGTRRHRTHCGILANWKRVGCCYCHQLFSYWSVDSIDHPIDVYRVDTEETQKHYIGLLLLIITDRVCKELCKLATQFY